MNHSEPTGFGLRQSRRSERPGMAFQAEVAPLERRLVLHGMMMSSPAPKIAEIAGILEQIDNAVAAKLTATSRFLSKLTVAEVQGLSHLGQKSRIYKTGQSTLAALNREMPNWEKVRSAAGQEVLRLVQSWDPTDPTVKEAAARFLESADRFDSLYPQLQSDKNACEYQLLLFKQN